MGRIFVSYSAKDDDFVRHIVADLTQKGHDLWFAPKDITGQSGSFWDEIHEGVRSSTHFLFVISVHSVDKTSHTHKEIFEALGGKPALQAVLVAVPTNTVNFNDLPILISARHYQIHDFSTMPYTAALARLEKALEPALNVTIGVQTVSVLPVKFTQKDVSTFALLIADSGRVITVLARTAFCSQIDVNTNDIDLSGATGTFSTNLVQMLFAQSRFASLRAACEVIKNDFDGNRSNELTALCRKLRNS